MKPGWRKVTFGDIAQNIAVRIDPAEATTDVYVGLEHLDPETLHLHQWGHPSDVIGQKLVFKKGDVIFGRRRAYQRKLAVAEFGGICSAHAMVVRAKPEMILPEFLPFFLQSDMFMERAIEISVGSLSPTINWKTLRIQEFPLPPIKEQERIAEILWAADEAVVRWDNVISGLESAKKSVLIRHFGLSTIRDVPWKQRKLKDVAKLQTGIAKGRKYSDNEDLITLPYLRVANVKDGFLDLNELKEITVRIDEAERYGVRFGDVLLTEGGDFDKLGRGTVWKEKIEPCLHQNHIFCVRTHPDFLISDYLSYQTGSPYGKMYFLKCAKKTSNLASINSTQVKNFPVQLPPLDVQKHLVEKISALEDQIKSAQAHIDLIKKFIGSMLSKFIRGGRTYV